MTEIKQANAALKGLTEQNRALEPMRSSQRTKVPDFERVRRHARNVFATLHKGLRGSCRASHKAHLYLKEDADRTSLLKEDVRFRIVLHHEHNSHGAALLPDGWLLEETEIRPMELITHDLSTHMSHLSVKTRTVRFEASFETQAMAGAAQASGLPPQIQSSLQEIKDLCASIQKYRAQQLNCGLCFGYLPDAAIPNNRHELYWPSKPFLDRNKIETEHLLAAIRKNELSIANSRHLAAALARGMLKLHNTPWLRNEWCSRDVTLFKNDGRLMGTHPFISAQVIGVNPVTATTSHAPKNPCIENEPVFALGILLIELCLRKPFEELLGPSDLNSDGSKHAASELFAANRLLSQVNDTAGYDYGDVVRRCIKGFDKRETSLDDPAFRRAFFEGVVTALEEDAKNYPN
jgi:hypothetical protein